MIKNFLFHLIFIFTIVLLLLLCFWQTQRLEWKNNLIKSINLNQNSVIDEFPSNDENSKYEFMNTSVKGKLLTSKKMFFYKFNLNGESGYEIVIPMELNSKKFIYTILGWIPFDAKDNFELDEVFLKSEMTIKGALIYSKERKLLIPENDTVTNTWYLLNTSEMDKYHKIKSSKYMIKLLDQSFSDNILIEFEPSNITNNHFQYAVTWFLLSFVIMIMYIYYIRQRV